MYDSIMSVSARNALSRLSETVAEKASARLRLRRLFPLHRALRSVKCCRK